MLLDTLTPSETYSLLVQSVVPRPIAWVLSEQANGKLNLAPFSYFNAVCSDPPLIMLSIGRKSSGEPKDTRRNIEERDDFVVHIPDSSHCAAVNQSAASLGPEESEIEELGLGTAPMAGSRLPRLAGAKIAMACRRHRMLDIGNGGQSVIFGEIISLFVDDTIVRVDGNNRTLIDAQALAPLARLGGGEFAHLGETFSLVRPK